MDAISGHGLDGISGMQTEGTDAGGAQGGVAPDAPEMCFTVVEAVENVMAAGASGPEATAPVTLAVEQGGGTEQKVSTSPSVFLKSRHQSRHQSRHHFFECLPLRRLQLLRSRHRR